jgi:hypothetical protein
MLMTDEFFRGKAGVTRMQAPTPYTRIAGSKATARVTAGSTGTAFLGLALLAGVGNFPFGPVLRQRRRRHDATTCLSAVTPCYYTDPAGS